LHGWVIGLIIWSIYNAQPDISGKEVINRFLIGFILSNRTIVLYYNNIPENIKGGMNKNRAA
jgi:hypothetical protein